MSQRTKLLVAGGAAGVVLVVFAVWFFIFRDTAPDAVSLEGAIDAVTTTTVASSGETTTTTSGGDETTTTAPGTGDSLDGTWTIDTTRGAGDVEASSYAGYRVQEELARIGTVTAVGRSTSLLGSFTFADSTLTAGDIVVDMTQLTSDSGGRDRQMQTQALETNTFPEASFVLTAPVDLGAVPQPNVPFQADVTGDLMIHGVTQSVTIPIEGQLVDDTVVIVGSTDVLFSDYDIDRPSAAIVLSVEDEGVMEFQLFLVRS